MERLFTAWSKLLFLIPFGAAVYLAATRPVTLPESLFWSHLVRPGFREALTASDAWSGLLEAILAKRSAGLLRLSEFSLRLPAILACAAYLAVLAQRATKRTWALAGLAAVAPILAGW